ncbi:septum formation initiator family protein [Daejeonella sp.]|uniref:FtsB family cell division protein n=1 Tax=Daejeonella sp. TaxID=2805397 RepID=UPI0025C72C9C|nr:septum formation initiator family protein [Daejeonella sp.]
MTRLLNIIRNKYLIASVAFLAWMLFFDRNDLMSQYEYRTQVNKLKAEKEFYTQETAKVVKDLNELTTNQGKLEKFAREKYLMKKENEDVFVIIEEAPKEEESSFFGK